MYGKDWDLQNLDWTLELLEGSCELELSDKVQEDLMTVGTAIESVLVFFFFAMKQIVSSTEDAIASMVTTIKTMKLSSFNGENVSKATG